MAVSFFTCADGGVPIVELLDSAGSVLKTIEGTSSQYYQRRHHDVVLEELSPKTSYEYAVGFKGAEARSAKFAFKTAPVGDDDVVFTAAVIGDMGVNNSAGTIARLTELAPRLNLTIHLGDVAYADDCNVPLDIEPSAGRSYEAVYDLYQQSVEPFAALAPYMVMPGNHDVSCHVLGDLGCPKELRNFSAFRHRFRMPSVESGATSLEHHNMWHSWRVGNVHFVALSSESDFPGAPTTPSTTIGGGAGGGFDGDQLAWLREDLAAARAEPSVKWIVAMAHRPWYASSNVDWPVLAPHNVKKAFEPLLYEFGVDIWLCGHKHYYERTVAAYAGKADPLGAVTIINGAAGNNEGVDSARGVGGLTVAANYDAEGYGELSQLNATALRWRYFLSADGSIADELVLAPRAKQLVV